MYCELHERVRRESSLVMREETSFTTSMQERMTSAAQNFDERERKKLESDSFWDDFLHFLMKANAKV
jgi:hypothetical protein